MMKTYVLYHANCPDGFGAAHAAWKTLKDTAEYLPVQHNQPLPDMVDKARVYLVDFCYPAALIIALAQRMAEVRVLDHHQSAQKDIQSLDLSLYPNLHITFDMQKSGAVLAWEHFHPDTPVPELLRYIEDKDLWRFALPQSAEFSAGLRSYDFDFGLWDTLSVEKIIAHGKVLLQYQNRTQEKLLKNVFFREIGGYEVPVVNSPILQSEIGNALCRLYPDRAFAAVYFEDGEKRYFSLRSVGEFDVSSIAVSLGGGGHRNAAGFVQARNTAF